MARRGLGREAKAALRVMDAEDRAVRALSNLSRPAAAATHFC